MSSLLGILFFLNLREGQTAQTLAKGFIDRGTLLGEELRSVFSDVKTIFETYSELAVDYYGRFVTKTHPGFDWSFVAAHKVGPLVPVEPDTVTGAMRQARHFVIRTKSGIGDHFAGGRID